MKYRVLFLLVAACGGSTSSDDGTQPVGPTPHGPGTNDPPSACDGSIAKDILVSRSLNGAPPYAVSGCDLVYVNDAGALVTRDLATGKETTLASVDEAPAHPVVTQYLVAWEATIAGKRVVRVHDGEKVLTVPAPLDAAEPRAAGKTVVFTVWKTSDPRGDTDVWSFDPFAGATAPIFEGPAQQRWADVSDAFVVATDFLEEGPTGGSDDDGRDVADIVVFDRRTGTKTTRSAPGKQAFAMLTSTDAFAYLDWAAIHPEPKLEAFQLRAGKVADAYANDHVVADVKYASSEYARPAVFGSVVEWIANPTGETVLWRAPLDGSAQPAQVEGLGGLFLYAPAPAAGFTVLAAAQVKSSDFTPRLRSVPR